MPPKVKLRPEWELFARYFVTDFDCFGNATRAYAKAYKKDLNNKSSYKTCRTAGARLLANRDILDRINQLLVELVMNDVTVDNQLAFLIMQMGDYGAKIQAIKEYNKLKQRITDKIDLRFNAVKEILEKYGIDDVGQAPQTEKRSSEDPK